MRIDDLSPRTSRRRPTGSSPTTARSPGRSPSERTSYSSQLIPVTAYILVGVLRGLPALPGHDAAHRRGRCRRRRSSRPATGPGAEINSVHLWSIANFWLARPQDHGHACDPCLDDPVAALTVLDFWERAARAYRRRRHPPGLGHRHVPPVRRRRARRAAGRRRSGSTDPDERARLIAVQRHGGEPPVPAVVRHAVGHRRHRPLPAARRSGAAGPGVHQAGDERLPVVGGRRRHPLPHAHRGAGARRRGDAGHRLRLVQHHPRGLPRTPGRVRAVHHGHAGRLAASRSPSTGSTTW